MFSVILGSWFFFFLFAGEDLFIFIKLYVFPGYNRNTFFKINLWSTGKSFINLYHVLLMRIAKTKQQKMPYNTLLPSTQMNSEIPWKMQSFKVLVIDIFVDSSSKNHRRTNIPLIFWREAFWKVQASCMCLRNSSSSFLTFLKDKNHPPLWWTVALSPTGTDMRRRETVMAPMLWLVEGNCPGMSMKVQLICIKPEECGQSD